MIYCQILVGATMRHLGAGLAIPDFPWVFGGVLPPTWTAGVAVHFAHRAGAILVAAAVLATAGHVWFHHRSRLELVRPAMLLVFFVVTQIALGAFVVLSGLQPHINSAHVVNGALVLATSLVLTRTLPETVLALTRALNPVASTSPVTLRPTNCTPRGTRTSKSTLVSLWPSWSPSRSEELQVARAS